MEDENTLIIIKAFQKLKVNNENDFGVFSNYLTDRLQYLREMSDDIDNEKYLLRNQGARAEIKRILKFIYNYDEIENYIEEQKKNKKAEETLGGL